jgi:SAM-dependent methyltransferase
MQVNDWNEEIVERSVEQWGRPTSQHTLGAFTQASRGELLVDLGCGFGRWYEWLMKNKKEPFFYVGVDGSEAMIKYCQDKFEESEFSMFMVKDVTEPLDFIQAKGTTILCNSVLIHLLFEDQDKVLHNILFAEPARAVFDIEYHSKHGDLARIKDEMGGQFYRTWNDPIKFERRVIELFEDYEVIRLVYPYSEKLSRHLFVALTKI